MALSTNEHIHSCLAELLVFAQATILGSALESSNRQARQTKNGPVRDTEIHLVDLALALYDYSDTEVEEDEIVEFSNSPASISLRLSFEMGPPQMTEALDAERVGPHPSYIEIARPYVFQHTITASLAAASVSEAKDDSIRLQGVTWIDGVRKYMQL